MLRLQVNLLQQLKALQEENAKLKKHVMVTGVASFNVEDNAAWIEYFHKHGFVKLDNVVADDTIERARGGLNRLVDQLADRLQEEGFIDDKLCHEPFETRIWNLHKKCQDRLPNLFRAELHQIPEIFEFMCSQKLLQVVQKLMPEAERIRIFPNYSVRPKTPAKVGGVQTNSCKDII